MRRADRLFQIVQALRGGRLVTARDLAHRLEVSERTIYRDMAELMATGVPITGEAGSGYVLRGGFDIPPLMFTADEVEALLVGARMVKAWGGTTLVRAAEEALAKIEAVIPSALRDGMAQSRLFAPGFSLSDDARARLDLLRNAIAGRRFIQFGYTDEAGGESVRRCRPLGLYFWGKVWTLVGWCELRNDFRMFRIDRMGDPTVEDVRFQPEPGRNLTDFLRTVIPAGTSAALPGT